MKIQNTNYLHAYYVSIIIGAFMLLGCSDKADWPPKGYYGVCVDFLGCFSDTVWQENSTTEQFYLKFQSGISNPYQMFQDDDGCFMLLDATEFGSFTVQENTSSQLKLFYDFNGDDEVYTFKSLNGQILVTIEYYENGALDETNTLTFNKSSMDVNSLTICD